MRKPTDPADSVRLPRITVRSDVAKSVLDGLVVSGATETVTVFARANNNCSVSFVDELVRLLVLKGYRNFEVRGASSDLTDELVRACEKYGATVGFNTVVV